MGDVAFSNQYLIEAALAKKTPSNMTRNEMEFEVKVKVLLSIGIMKLKKLLQKLR
jgi:hypothetical protein